MLNKKPNIILINCDDLGYGDLACYGSAKNDTPCLDMLADNGMKFTDFYMASPICSPSRGALMTGCYPPRIGFGSFDGKAVLFPGDRLGLNSEEKSLASIIKEAGYKTSHIGKWHCGDQEGFLPTDHGFDEYYGIPYSNDMGMSVAKPPFPPLPLMKGKEVIQQQPDQSAITERYTEKCVDFIKKNKKEPFFLYLAHMHVHLPLYVADSFIQQSRNGEYGACVMAIDWSTSVIVDTLKKQGIYDDTIIIFTSDNGSRNDFGQSNGVLRGSKGETWEGGLRVPFIVHWNGNIEKGESSEIITSLDLLPSLSKIVGGKVPTDRVIDGMDLSEFMLGKVEKSERNTFYYYLCNTLEAVRVGDYKLHITKPNPPKRVLNASGMKMRLLDDNHEVKELYNLKEDPSERVNIYNENPDIVEIIMKEVKKARTEVGDAYTRSVPDTTREIGVVNNPKPLTEYDENHPYIITFYDKTEIG